MRSVELAPGGLGARQLHQLTQFLALDAACGPVLIHPLEINAEPVGVLLLAAAADIATWPPRTQRLLPGLTRYVAQALVTNRQRPLSLPPTTPPSAPREVKADPLVAKVLAQLETTQGALKTERSRRTEVEAQLGATQQQVRDLSMELARLEETGTTRPVTELEAQIAALRSALEKADKAVMEAGSDSGDLNSEWVVMTITRYSAQLDEAQTRIVELEARLAEQNRAETS
jgi:cob(I)alamin adenosyltransferase